MHVTDDGDARLMREKGEAEVPIKSCPRDVMEVFISEDHGQGTTFLVRLPISMNRVSLSSRACSPSFHDGTLLHCG
jgi:hypothetical protein